MRITSQRNDVEPRHHLPQNHHEILPLEPRPDGGGSSRCSRHRDDGASERSLTLLFCDACRYCSHIALFRREGLREGYAGLVIKKGLTAVDGHFIQEPGA